METPAQVERRWTWGLFAAALLLRVLHVLAMRDHSLFNRLYIDPRMYDEWGARIADGALLADAPFFLDPLYPYFIASIYVVFGRSMLAVALTQALLGAAVAPLVHTAARRWFEPWTARIAGAVAAAYPVSIYYSSALLKPALALFLAALVLWYLSRGLERRRSRDWLGAGLAFSALVLTRGNLLWALPGMVLGLWGRWRAAAAFVGGATLVLALPTAHNFIVSGELIPTTANFGQIFYIGNNPTNPDGRFQELPWVRSRPEFEQVDFKAEAERREGRELSHRAVSRFWFAESRDFIADSPGRWLGLMWSKLRLWWGGYETPASLDFYLYRRHSPVLRLPTPAFGLLGPLALLGGWFAVRVPGWPRLLVLYVALTCLTLIPFFVLTRFRMVAVPALCALAAHGAVELCRCLRRRQRWRIPAALFCVAFIFVNFPVRAPADTWSYRLADTLRLPRKLETTAHAHFNLGVTLAADAADSDDPRELLVQAEKELRAAIAGANKARYQTELAKVLARLERNAEAVAAFGKVLDLEPGNYRTHHAIGLLRRRMGQLQEAERSFLRAVELAPTHAAGAVQLGQVLLEQGRKAEAADWFRHALQLRPGDPEAIEGLKRAES